MMPFSNNTKMANRYGLDIAFYTYDSNGNATGNPVATITFANEVSLELTSELTWATGGQNHANRIGFKDPTQGTLSISTQLVTMEMLALAAGTSPASIQNNTVSFKNDATTPNPTSYIVKGTTLWQGEDGTSYYEEVTVYKATVKPGYSVTYNGSGDPQTLEISFELGTNDSGKVVDIVRGDKDASNDGTYTDTETGTSGEEAGE